MYLPCIWHVLLGLLLHLSAKRKVSKLKIYLRLLEIEIEIKAIPDYEICLLSGLIIKHYIYVHLYLLYVNEVEFKFNFVQDLQRFCKPFYSVGIFSI